MEVYKNCKNMHNYIKMYDEKLTNFLQNKQQYITRSKESS